jgi:hypothetical protein
MCRGEKKTKQIEKTEKIEKQITEKTEP